MNTQEIEKKKKIRNKKDHYLQLHCAEPWLKLILFSFINVCLCY